MASLLRRVGPHRVVLRATPYLAAEVRTALAFILALGCVGCTDTGPAHYACDIKYRCETDTVTKVREYRTCADTEAAAADLAFQAAEHGLGCQWRWIRIECEPTQEVACNEH